MADGVVAIVDLDGPLLDGRTRHHTCYAGILSELGAASLPIADYWELKRSGVDRRAQLAATGAGAHYDTFLHEWLARIERAEMLALDEVQPGAIDTLERWRSHGVLIVLATHRRDAVALTAQLEATGLRPHLDVVVPSPPSGGAAGKADAVIERLGSRPAAGAWIGDTAVDVAAARHLGLSAWAVSCGVRSAEALRAAEPDLLAPDLASLPDVANEASRDLRTRRRG